MRYARIGLLFSLASLVLTTAGVCQEIFEKDGLYTTGELTVSTCIGSQKKLVIQAAASLSGRVEIGTTQQPEITVTYTKQSKTDNRSKAIDYIDLVSISLDSLPEYIRLQLRAPNPAPWDKEIESGMIVALVTVPEDFFVEVKATYFDVTARGPLTGLVVPSSLGRMDVSHVDGRLELSTANRRVKLEDIRGIISVSTTNSSIVAREITSDRGVAKFRNDGGDIKIMGLRGEANVKNRYGRISIVDFRPRGESSFIRGSSGPIILEISEMSSGQLVVSNRHEDIEITIPDTLQAFFSLAVSEEGMIEVTNFPFKTDLVQRDRLNLLAGDGPVEISGSIRGRGNIYIRGIRGD